MRPSQRLVAAALAALAALAACRTAGREPAPTTSALGAAAPAPAAPAPTATMPQATDTGRARGRAADVRFMQHMIVHHGQALTMAALAPARSRRDDVRLLAERIAISQRDEIALMQRWLAAHGAPAPAPGAEHAHHAPGGDHAAMPGMLTAEELARLEAASGPEFDRLFLTYMIRHHEGALAMVAEYLAAPGAGQDPTAFTLASEVDAGQRAEIRRMRAMLDAPPGR